MAKKTKKEKVLAEYHRKLQTLGKPEFIVHSSQYKLPQEQTISTINSVYNEPQTDYSYVLSDLQRIGLLTALAICAQIVLWYILGK